MNTHALAENRLKHFLALTKPRLNALTVFAVAAGWTAAVGKQGDPHVFAATVLGNRNARPELRLYDLERGAGSRFTFGDQGANFPVWSPDGRRIGYGDVGQGIRIKPADGGSEGKVVLAQKSNIWPLSW